MTSQTFWLGRGVIVGVVLTLFSCLDRRVRNPGKPRQARAPEGTRTSSIGSLPSCVRRREAVALALPVTLSLGVAAGILALAWWQLGLLLPCSPSVQDS